MIVSRLALFVVVALTLTKTTNAVGCTSTTNCAACKAVGGCDWCVLAVNVTSTTKTTPILTKNFGICNPTASECVQSYGTIDGLFANLPTSPFKLQTVVVKADMGIGEQCTVEDSSRVWNELATCEACHTPSVTQQSKNVWCQQDAKITYPPELHYTGSGGICMSSGYEMDCHDGSFTSEVAAFTIAIINSANMTDSCPSGAAHLKPGAVVLALVALVMGTYSSI